MGAGWFNEIWDVLLFHGTQHAPAWATPGGTAYLVLVCLNVEISLMFGVMGIVVARALAAHPAGGIGSKRQDSRKY